MTKINNIAKFSIIFAGQATPWRTTLQELTQNNPNLKSDLQTVLKDTKTILEPIAADLLTIYPTEYDLLGNTNKNKFNESNTFLTIPGILLSQYAVLSQAVQYGLDLNEVVDIQGHSQGILGKELIVNNKLISLKDLSKVIAVATIIGAGGQKVAQDNDILVESDASAMLSVKGISEAKIKKIAGHIAVKNNFDNFVISGFPSQLKNIEQQVSKLEGVVPEFLDVYVPFHNPILEPALPLISSYFEKTGLNNKSHNDYAKHILVDSIDFVQSINETVKKSKTIIDLGPGDVVAKMSYAIAQGSGATIIPIGSAKMLTDLSLDQAKELSTIDYNQFAPSVETLPNGKDIVSTKFTRFTGLSPVMLAGMTPTTVEADIIAAAANAGHWAEMAGGGQVTADVYNENLEDVKKKLNNGKSFQFNSMFLDRYLWNLQFGGTKIVSKSRASGAPINGVVITAGIPELDEAVELVQQLNNEGFPYIAFKPGTVKQINDVLKIAKKVPTYTVIMEVEDGHAGGHHSWENLDDLLLNTYAKIRNTPNVILAVGGGIATAEIAAKYMTGSWANVYNLPNMPVDSVLVGTVAMVAKEAKTSSQVKKLLAETKGISIDDNGGWVKSLTSKGGMTSSLSHLRADIYEVDNDSAKASKAILEYVDLPSDTENSVLELAKDKMVKAINKTAKPFFGDVSEMTYGELVKRYIKLCFDDNPLDAPSSLISKGFVPEFDLSWYDRLLDLLQRIEARFVDKEVGKFVSLLKSIDDVKDYEKAIKEVFNKYPSAKSTKVTAIDADWFIDLCRKHPKPLPFVPRIDGDVFKWWSTDSLWQSHDSRYPANSCRIIPGPVSIQAMQKVDEPIASLLGRFDNAILKALGKSNKKVYSRIGDLDNAIDYIKGAKHISWTGHLIDNPAFKLRDTNYTIEKTSNNHYDLTIILDTYWDEDKNKDRLHAVRKLNIPLVLNDESYYGSVPVVDETKLGDSMFSMLAATAGVGSTMTTGDDVKVLPVMEKVKDNTLGGHKFTVPKYGRAKFDFTVSNNLGLDHRNTTGRALGADFELSNGVPDAILGCCWPPIYSALGSVQIGDLPVIEGLLNAVHLDHTIDMLKDYKELEGQKLSAYGFADSVKESVSGRIVDIRVVVVNQNDELVIVFRERFAVQGRAYGNNIPDAPEDFGGRINNTKTEITKRRLLSAAVVKAPNNMTAFARVSGDYNPIHTSTNAAIVAGLPGPIVHGMWLSATAQHLVEAKFEKYNGYKIIGWTAQWFNPTQLGDQVVLTLERTGSSDNGNLLYEVVAKIDDVLTARFTATVKSPVTAYCFPGQGIQHQGMTLDEINKSKATKAAWDRADKITREQLGFSILNVVRDNPTQITVKGETFHHPDGVLNLTQFTQVALSVVGYAQTRKFDEAGLRNLDGYFAGHSLGEYVSLSAISGVIPFDINIQLVFARGSAMHGLVQRDENGKSNYLMAALRPNQFGISDSQIKEYIEKASKEFGEFLEIVNYNLAGQQYAVAGTIKGLQLLEQKVKEDVAKHGGKAAFILVPGIDVPFHSSKLRDGVDDFRDKLEKFVPLVKDYDSLVNKYIPNLVARKFELTYDFAKSILDEVPSKIIKDLTSSKSVFDKALQDKPRLAKTLLVELLCWQFASPVRWIETQALLFGEFGVERFIEIGLKNAPTLANMATKTLKEPEFADKNVEVLNIGRDEARVYLQDDDALVEVPEVIEESDLESLQSPSDTILASSDEVTSETVVVEQSTETSSNEEVKVSTTPIESAVSGGPAAGDITFKASNAIDAIFAYANKLNPSQIETSDNAETLTNGASARRNQMLMDMTAELGIASIDSAAEASVAELRSLVDKLVPNYSAFGSVLGEATKVTLRKLFGASGVKPTQIVERVTTVWGLNQGWADFVTIEILLGTRAGDSMRGGSLSTLGTTQVASASEVDSLIDNAVQSVANSQGVSVSLASSGGTGGEGGTVSSEALDALSEKVIGKNGVLVKSAYNLLNELGVIEKPVIIEEDTDTKLILETVTEELGSNWVKAVTPKFNANKVIELDDKFAWDKELLAMLFTGQHPALDCVIDVLVGSGETISKQAKYYATKSTGSKKALFEKIAKISLESPKEEYKNDVAVVTGAAPKSIAGGLAAKLLKGGATVIITASSINSKRLDFAKQLYHDNASPSAKLYLVEANLTSYRDLDALCEWIGEEQKETVGATTKILKPALYPTLLFPFAAPNVLGKLDTVGPTQEIETRLLLWSVERMIGHLSKLGVDNDIDKKLHIILPGSPNRGIFGGDGSYGEVKAAFDAIENKWFVEKDWAGYTTIAHPKIGWVKGTSLMGGNDPLVDAVEAKGIHTYTTEEISDELLSLCTEKARKQAEKSPIDADFTGGLGSADFNLAELAAEAMASLPSTLAETDSEIEEIDALPTPQSISIPKFDSKLWKKPTQKLEDMRVIVGYGEVSPWGSSRTRFEAEHGIKTDGDFDLTPAAVTELAWMMDLIHYSETPKASWYNAKDEPIEESAIYDLYHDEVVARCGVRFFTPDKEAKFVLSDIFGQESQKDVAIFLDKDISFSVESKKDAEQYKEIDPDRTEIYENENGEWVVEKKAGATVRVPRYVSMPRLIGGQLPTGFDPAKWGIPASMLESVDRLALWNIVATVDAFISSGFSPAELLKSVHPSQVGLTQGTGIGGTDSMHKLFVDTFLGEDKPSDILQEALPNVIAAHVMQSYVGGYGPMVHPVGACATAAVSIEDAVDKIDTGKADFVVAGAIDDIDIESISGFADMNATANSKEMLEKGINERFVSRANDKRRAGFVEAEGGGTVLITRGDIALKLGLPVFGIIAYSRSFADGAHTSIPAPGLGALGSVRGGTNSKFVKDLASLGLTTNDIQVISKHDTSTNANDPNESELYTLIHKHTERTDGNPLFVISQKTVTGHAKGGAAVFQINGLCQLFQTNKIPANKTLDCVGQEFKNHEPITWLRNPLQVPFENPIKAACLTSLGFGHVSGLICVVNPAVFQASLSETELKTWLDKATKRLELGKHTLDNARLNKATLFEPIEHRRFPEGVDIHDAEIELLLQPEGRI